MPEGITVQEIVVSTRLKASASVPDKANVTVKVVPAAVSHVDATPIVNETSSIQGPYVKLVTSLESTKNDTKSAVLVVSSTVTLRVTSNSLAGGLATLTWIDDDVSP